MGSWMEWTWIIRSVLCLAYGAGLGLLFFGGLWYTVDQLPRVTHPWRWLLLSSVLRFSLVGFGFACVLHGTPEPVALGLISCLGGFVCSRFFCVYWFRRGKTWTHPEQTT